MNNGKLKVYAYYLKELSNDGYINLNEDVYAFTIDKAIRDEFELERSMDLFYKKIFKMDQYEYEGFSYSNQNAMLFSNVLSDGTETISFVTTYFENDKLDENCRLLEDSIIKIQKRLEGFPLKKKVKKDLDKILTYWGNGMDDNIYHFDTFHMFIDLFCSAILSGMDK